MIKTERLIIKPFEKGDCDRAIKIFTDEKVKKTYMLPDFESKDKAIQLFNRLKELSVDDTRYVRGIYLDDMLIGLVNDVGIENGKIEVGYAIDSDYHSQGYGTEMLQAVLKYLAERGYGEIQAGAFEDNRASTRIMEKAGMELIDFTEEIEYRGKTHKCVYYSYKK